MADTHPIQAEVQAGAAAAIGSSPDAADAAARAAAAFVVAALRSGSHPPREAVVHACHGAMSALLLQEKDTVQGAVRLLHALGDAAQETGADPMEMMTWAMEGIAMIAPLLQPAPLFAMREAIEKSFMGAGEIFEGLCERMR